jgi:hypothetical protein
MASGANTMVHFSETPIKLIRGDDVRRIRMEYCREDIHYLEILGGGSADIRFRDETENQKLQREIELPFICGQPESMAAGSIYRSELTGSCVDRAVSKNEIHSTL